MENYSNKALKRSQLMYVFEATFEYLISILVRGSFLATLTKEIGIPDSVTGVISSIISLGCVFQLLSILLRAKKVKIIVIIMSLVNQILFMLLYVVPLFEISKTAKSVIFVVLIVSAYVIYNFVHPKKMNWFMSLVDNKKRGIFTANKEIISLILGMIFTFAMGSLIDYFKDYLYDVKTAFILSAIVIFALMVVHTLTMIFSVEKDLESSNKTLNLKQTVISIFKNKKLLRVTFIFLIYQVATHTATPFLATYKLNELGFDLAFASILVTVGSVSRCIVSRFWGKYADKFSFAAMIEKCFIALAIGYVFVVFATPKTGVYALTLYYIFHGISQGGINSALTNLVFDYVPYESRSDSLAVCQAFAGLTAFLSTLIFSNVVSIVQAHNNIVFGVKIYAQQILAVIGLFLLVILIFYVRKTFLSKSK